MSRADAIEGKARVWRRGGKWVVELELPAWVAGDLADELQTGTALVVDIADQLVTTGTTHLLLVQSTD